ncbi:hypothetical protein STCU_10624 [Strigomonas culicis]|uniref:Uncharacterized protein n=1 Tax=Strigomonas culicis TaxID=28005 RepID=S9TM44_9TRYP|nr:hypothetical protein STCU_10624 [Strigomonas culicis]|eukprot:EPY17433.1 hypothetical protein STCU_10624 [Strigomonas culicis]
MTKGFGRMLYLTSTIGFLLASAEDGALRQLAAMLLGTVKETPKFKDKSCSLSYVRPFAMCEYASALYEVNGKEETTRLFDKLNKEYSSPHYYFHSLIDTRIHMVQSFFKNPLTLKPQPAGKGSVGGSDTASSPTQRSDCN